MAEITRRIDSSGWTVAHDLIFISTSLGMLIWGLEAAIGPVGYLTFHRSLFFLVAYYALDFIGDLVIARFSDTALARKGAFYLTMSMIGAGLLVLGVDIVVTGGTGLLAVIVGLAGAALMKVGIEGDVPVSLAFLAENSPAKYRNRVLVLAPNFANIGSAIGALVLWMTYFSTESYRYAALVLIALTIAALAIAFGVRVSMPESVRWLATKGMYDRAAREASRLSTGAAHEVTEVRPTVGMAGRFIFLVLLGVSQYLTFGLMAYTIAYFYYSGSTIFFIMFVASLGASVAGLPAALLAERMDSRDFTLLAFGGGLATMVLIDAAFALMTTGGFLSLFYPLLFLNMFFSELAWAVRTVYEPVLFPTNVRATMIGLIRVFPILSYDVSLYVTSSWGEAQFIIFNMAMWAVGAAAALFWKARGYDVRGALLESASSPVAPRGAAPTVKPK